MEQTAPDKKTNSFQKSCSWGGLFKCIFRSKKKIIMMKNIKPNQISVERIMYHLSIHDSTKNTQHTHNYRIFHATHVQHVHVSRRPSILFDQLCACFTVALHTYQRQRPTHGPQLYVQRFISSFWLHFSDPVTGFPILCNNYTKVKWWVSKEGPSEFNLFFDVLYFLVIVFPFSCISGEIAEICWSLLAATKPL